MTVKGVNKTPVLHLEEASNSNSSMSDVNLNHLKIVGLPKSGSFSPTSSPTREVPDRSSVIHLREKDDKFDFDTPIEVSKSSVEMARKSLEKEVERSPIHEVTQHLDNKVREEVTNGRTSVNIPSDAMASPKALKSPTTTLSSDRRNFVRVEQASLSPQHRADREQNSAKAGNRHNNNLNRTNSACLNNLILPLLSDVRIESRA